MTNITLAVDEEVVRLARERAQAFETTLNDLLRGYLEQLVGRVDLEAAATLFADLSFPIVEGEAKEWGFEVDERGRSASRGLVFFDASILLRTDDSSAGEQQEEAVRFVAQHILWGTAVVSLQVLQDYFEAATHKLGVPADVAQTKMEILAGNRMVGFGVEDLVRAIERTRLTGRSLRHAIIIQAAQSAGVSTLYSLEISARAVEAGMRVVNPFRGLAKWNP